MKRSEFLEKRFQKAVEAGYDPSSEFAQPVKENWKHAAKDYFRSLSTDFSPDAANIWFNAGGPAVSGDIHMQLMVKDKGFHLFGNLEFGFTIRSIRKLGDYTGGPNQPVSKDVVADRVMILNVMERFL